VKPNEAVFEASSCIVLQFAEHKKPHTLGENLIESCLVETVRPVLGKQHKIKMNQISLSNFTMKKCISEMSKDIMDQVVAEMKSLSILDNSVESTDVNFF
jgi:hypothetical protein